jgi:hypothetical protein
MDKKLPTTLEAFSNVVVVHFLGNKHLDLNMIKHCELSYLSKFAFFTWLKTTI